MDDFNICPCDAGPPPCAQRLEGSFLGSETGSEAFKAPASLCVTIRAFARGEASLKKAIPMVLDHLADARNGRDIDAKTYD